MIDSGLALNSRATHSPAGEHRAERLGIERSGGYEEQPSSRSAGSGSAIRTYFFVNCEVCGRSLRASVQLLGDRVRCQHCGNRFTAIDTAADGCSSMPANLRRATALLSAVDARG